jgi:hypothetical protein
MIDTDGVTEFMSRDIDNVKAPSAGVGGSKECVSAIPENHIKIKDSISGIIDIRCCDR